MELESSTIKGVIWSMIERFSAMGIQLICTLIIAQFLTPKEFGLISMMSIFLSFSSILVDSGFGQAIIRDQKATDRDYSSVFYINIIIGCFIYVLGYICSPFISSFYDVPQLTPLLRISFLVMFCYGLSVVQQALLFKNIQFKIVSRISVLSVVISGVIGIVFAYKNRNAWSLVAQALSFAVCRTILLWIYAKWRPLLAFSWVSIRKYLRFSVHLLSTNLISAISDNLANLVIGKVYTSVDLGNYTVPNKIQISVAGTISFSIHRVSYSMMATFQNDVDRLREYSQMIVNMGFFIIAPIMVFLALESEHFFLIILNPSWLTAASYFRILCISGVFFCFADINMDVLLVRGRSDIVLKIEIVRKLVYVCLLVMGVLNNMYILMWLLAAYSIFNTFFVSFWSGREINCGIYQQCMNAMQTTMSLIASILLTISCNFLFKLNGLFVSFIVSFILFFGVFIITSLIIRNRYLLYLVDKVKEVIKNR